MATNIRHKEQIVVLAKQLIAGTAKHLGSATQVSFTGGSYTPADITTKLQQIVTLRSDVDAAKASTKAKLTAEKTVMPSLRSLMAAYVTYLKAIYGDSPDVLADFGLSLKSRAPLTVVAKAGAVAKSAATRAARHTMGSRQKKAVKGDVTGVVVTPVSPARPTVATPEGTAAPATSGGVQAAPPPASATAPHTIS
jgi:hypothetical protein